MKRVLSLYFLIIVTLCLTESANAEEKVKIRIAQWGKEKILLYLPLYLAIEEKYFDSEGLSAELIFAGNDDQIFATVAGNSADIGMGDPVFTAIAQEKGFGAKTIAQVISKLAVEGYTNNPKIPVITSPGQLKGLKIGSFPKPSTTYNSLERFINQNNLKESGTKIIEGGFASQLGLLNGGIVDIAIDLEPTPTKLETEGYKIVFSLTEITESQVVTGIMTRESTIKDNPQLLQKALTALQRSLNLISKNPKQAKESACKIFKNYECTIIKKSLERAFKDKIYPKTLVVNSQDWQRSLQTRLTSNELKAPQETSVSVDNQFAIKAVNATRD